MKVSSPSNKVHFQPFTIEFTFESEQEVVDFFCLMNHGQILGVMSSLPGTTIREQLEQNYPSVKQKYWERHRELCNIIK